MNIEKKNLPESVYTKLKNIALTKNRPTQEVLRYYAMERFLYRLSASEHKNSFFLKGGLMLMVWDPATHRATVDIDLLAKASNSIENISRILKEICAHPVPQDGIEFNSTDLILAESQIETEYTGLSARFSARLHTAKLQIAKKANKIYGKIVDCLEKGMAPDSRVVQALIKEHCEFAGQFHEMSKNVYNALAELYSEHPEYRKQLDPIHSDLVPFLTEAMRIFADKNLS